MKTLLILDKKDYTEDMPVFEKFSTRAVIIRNGKIATQHGNAGDYKILGGGVEPGEDLHEALIREVQEESGLVVIPSSIQTIGEIVERRRDIFDPNMVYVCHSCFFFCDAEEKMVEIWTVHNFIYIMQESWSPDAARITRRGSAADDACIWAENLGACAVLPVAFNPARHFFR